MSDLPAVLNADTIPVVLKRLGIPMKGDAELNMLGQMPLRPCDQILNSDVTTAAMDMGFSADDATLITDALTVTDVGTGAA